LKSNDLKKNGPEEAGSRKKKTGGQSFRKRRPQKNNRGTVKQLDRFGWPLTNTIMIRTVSQKMIRRKLQKGRLGNPSCGGRNPNISSSGLTLDNNGESKGDMKGYGKKGVTKRWALAAKILLTKGTENEGLRGRTNSEIQRKRAGWNCRCG